MGDATKTEGLYLTIPTEWIEKIDRILGPMQTRQDFIRMAIEEKLKQLPEAKKQ